MQSTVFCELPVIEQIINDYWKTRMDVDSSQDNLTKTNHWFLLLSKFAELVIDIDKTDFIELALKNPIYKQLLKNSVSGGSKIQHWKEHIIDIEKDNRYEDFPTALFLLDRTEAYCNQKIKEYGLIFLNGENYKSFTKNLFFLSDVQVKTNKKRSDISEWSDFRRLTHPMNSLILTDNFILSDKLDISINLIPLLDALLPDKLNKCKFQLMIITKEMDPPTFNTRYAEVLNQIGKLNRNYEIEFSLITASIGKTHDRRIFTNYSLLESNNSFTYFDADGKVKKNTTLHAFPSCLVASGNELMLNKNLNTLAEVKTLIKNHARQSKGPDSGITNRLLDMVVE